MVTRYNGPQNQDDGATALALDRSGNVYVTGGTYFTNTGLDYTTVKYNSAGAQQWVARYSNNGESNADDRAVAIAVDAFGNSYVTGSSAAAEYAALDYATVKYNSAGVQRWVARYNGPANDSEFVYDLAVDNSGNVYVTGDSWEQGAYVDYATIKYNAGGVQEWIDRYNGPAGNYDVPRAIVSDAAGNVYVTGASRSYGGIWGDQDDFATIKYSPAGTKQWITRYSAPANGNDQATALAVDAAGNVYVTGRSEAANNDYDFATVKYSASGSQLWLNRESGPGSSRDYARAFTVDGAGNVYLTGFSEGVESTTDFATVKFNSEGAQQWAARYNGPGNFYDYVADIAVDAAGNVYVTGESDGVDTRRDYATVKYNSAGVQQWAARYNAPGDLPDSPIALGVDRWGNVYVTGTAYYSSDGLYTDLTTIKYDANGNEQWIVAYNGSANLSEHASGLAIDAIGNIYVTGASSLADGTLDYLTIKYNSAGGRQWVAHYNGVANLVDVAVAVAADKFGNVYVTGASRAPATSYDFVTIKYRADDGKPLWIASYNGAGNSSDRPVALAVDKSGNVYVTGSSFEAAGRASPYLTVNYNPQGVEQWAARYSGNVNEFYEVSGLGVDDFGNVFVTGYSYSQDYVQTTVKYDAAGVERWVSKRYGDSAPGVALDFFGNVYVAGSTSGTYWSAYTITKYIESAQSLSLPDGYSLAQNYPNPFNYATSFRYALPASGRVTLKVFNLVGQEVATVVDAERAAGIHEVDWGGEKLPSGVYVYRLQINGFAQTRKFVMLK
ncbi:MAG: SBBP repeat-containing protein [bacterium]